MKLLKFTPMKNRYTIQKLLLSLVLIFITRESTAQLVYIPDPNFRTFISSLDPTAMIGDSLDINNSTIINTDVLNIQPSGIQDLTGIEYFTSLRKLECYDNTLSTLNAVPFSLDTLLIENALIITLPMLPNSMIWLGCAFCSNLSGFTNIPSGLVWLGISYTAVNSIVSLPPGLQYLECIGAPLFDMPQLPQSMLLINCMNCSQLTCLPTLPDNLVQLTASGSGITCLPNIPNNGSFSSDIGTTLCVFAQSTVTNASCNGTCDGAINLSMIGGTGPFQFTWSIGAIVQNIVALCASSIPYACTITGSDGCVATISDTIHEPVAILIDSINSYPVNCTNSTDGIIDIYASGGVLPFVYSIDSGVTYQSSFEFLNLAADSYFIIVQDAAGCYAIDSVLVYEPTPVSVTAIQTNVSCNGGNDGSITAIAFGGIPAYQYSINGMPWQVSAVFNNLNPGFYTVAARDINGCVGIYNLTIMQPNLLTIATTTTDATCGLSDGSIIINATGGTPPYLYSIDFGITYQASNFFTNDSSAHYTTSVIDANFCLAYIHTIVSGIGGPVINNLVTTNATCSNVNNGSIVVNASGGTLPYQYSTDTAITLSTSNVLLSLYAGNYMVAMVDAAGCWTTANTVINSPSPISIFTLINNVTCNGGNDGSFTVNASNGVPPYQYSIDGGITFQPDSLFDTLVAGNYTVLVEDANGCTNPAGTTIIEPPPLTFGNILSNYLVCNANPVNVCFTISGGTPAYTYLWSQGSITNCISVTPGVYTITVADANGCTLTTTTSVTFTPGWQFVSLDSLQLPTCGMCDGNATAIMINTIAATYQWIPGNFTGATNPQLCDNTDYTLIATDTAGCIDTLNFRLSCHSVWPGDANNDGQADNTDLLAIGIGYGTTGAIRTNATINWQAEIGFDWTDSLASGTNYKHIDCNGDGIIADDDTIAIIQNFGLTHPLRPAIIPMVLTDPPLYFDIQIDSASVDTMLQIPLMLGTSVIPADSIYGIAFTVSYDTALVKADSVTMDFINCWMNSTTGHTIGIGINDPLNGKLYGAVTRTSHTDTSGFGELGRLGIVTVDNISARMSSLYSDTLILGISDVTLITHDEHYKTVNIIIDSLIINDNTVGIHEHTEALSLSVYPNPANRFLFLDYDLQIKNPVITLHSMLNEEIDINYKSMNGKTIVDLGTVANGMYLLRVTTDKGVVTRKINVIKQ